MGCSPGSGPAAARCFTPRRLPPICLHVLQPFATCLSADSAFFGPSKQYVRWDTGLHEVFEQAVEELGGPHAGA